MKTYEVSITEEVEHVLTVEAENEVQAEEEGIYQLCGSNIVLKGDLNVWNVEEVE